MHNHFSRSVGISATLIVVAFALGILAIFFMNGRLGERVARIADARARIVLRSQEVKRLADLKRDAPKAAQYERAIDILLPDINQLYSFREDWLEGFARSHSVALKNFSFLSDPVAPKPNELGSVDFTVAVSGNVKDVVTFFKQLEPAQPFRYLNRANNFSLFQTEGVYYLTVGGTTFFRSGGQSQEESSP